MKRMLTAAAVALVVFGAGAVTVEASHRRDREIIDGWYHRFLGRCVDPAGVDYWVPQLCRKPPTVVLSQLVASQEYYHRNGCCPEGFVRGLYRDVLGRTDLCHQDIHYWVCRLQKCGCRETLICEFLRDARVDVFALCGRPAFAAPPVAVSPPPVYAPPAPPAFAPPPPVYAPPPPVQGTGFRLQIRLGR
ncbi:MAG: DUF4214 domain-containing protein [Gemmataceae bacterium]|nr:DUF4214 domain-containing protein [Gemmataceae bacterium]